MLIHNLYLKFTRLVHVLFCCVWLDSNQRPCGYEPHEMTASLHRTTNLLQIL